MILRHRCRSLLSPSSLKPLSHRRRLPSSLNPRRCLRTTSSRQAESESPDDIDQTIEQVDELSPNPDTEARDVSRLQPSTSDLFGNRRRGEEDEERGFQTSDQIDASMSIEELGLKKMTRKAKQSFLRWIMQEGTRYERFPQHILWQLEERRIEKARKGSEDRMFQRMNTFFNTLSLEEIERGELVVMLDEKGRKKTVKREQQPEPSPFQQLMTGKIKKGMNLKQIESKALSLLGQYDQKLHTLYRNYIDWCDYQLQKRRIWFEFPNSQKYADVVARSRALTEDEVYKQEQRINMEEEKKAAKGRKRVEIPMETKAIIPDGIQLDAIEKTNKTLDDATDQTTITESENATKQPGESEETTKVSEKEVQLESEDPLQEEDLPHYLGPRIDESVKFPFLGTPNSNYLINRDHTPFRLNRTFKPWRPIPHSKRLQMFDAWREGLGLRNVAWLGGVSWRRVDGIIGILKREWEFVEKVLIPLTYVLCVMNYYSISLEDFLWLKFSCFLISPFLALLYSLERTS